MRTTAWSVPVDVLFFSSFCSFVVYHILIMVRKCLYLSVSIHGVFVFIVFMGLKHCEYVQYLCSFHCFNWCSLSTPWPRVGHRRSRWFCRHWDFSSLRVRPVMLIISRERLPDIYAWGIPPISASTSDPTVKRQKSCWSAAGPQQRRASSSLPIKVSAERGESIIAQEPVAPVIVINRDCRQAFIPVD